MKRDKFYKAVQDQLEIQAEKKAGYPPNCNEGYAEKDGKCVPVGENSESKMIKMRRRTETIRRRMEIHSIRKRKRKKIRIKV